IRNRTNRAQRTRAFADRFNLESGVAGCLRHDCLEHLKNVVSNFARGAMGSARTYGRRHVGQPDAAMVAVAIAMAMGDVGPVPSTRPKSPYVTTIDIWVTDLQRSSGSGKSP